MNPLYPRVFKYDLKVAGTETRPFLSILFSKLDKNIFFIKHFIIIIFQITLHCGIIWDIMGFWKIVNKIVFVLKAQKWNNFSGFAR